MFLVFPFSMKRLGQDSVQVSSHGAILCVIIFPINPQVRLILFILIQDLTLLLDESWFLPVTFSEGLFCGKH